MVCEFCHKYGLYLIEDNCDALGCTYTLPVERAEQIGLDHLLKIARKESTDGYVSKTSTVSSA